MTDVLQTAYALKSVRAIQFNGMKDTVKSKPRVAPRWPLASLIQKWENGEDVIFRNAPMVLITHAHNIGSLPSESCVIACLNP
jgi:hypothetical protein